MILNNRLFYNILRANKTRIPVLLNNNEETLIRLLSTTSCRREDADVNKMVEYGIREEKSSKAMRAYLERSQSYNKFMAEEREEYRTGKRHLANIMGVDPETFTQSDVDEAIKYLLPSGLFVKKTRPFFKPPEEVHPPKKEAEFDETGRPFHYLFYTAKPDFYEFLHKLVDILKELDNFHNMMLRKNINPDPKLALDTDGYEWLSKEQFEEKFIEELAKLEYRQLIDTLDRLVKHPYSYRVKDVIMDCRKTITLQSAQDIIPKPDLEADGREVVTFKDSRRKTARADVTVRSPGTGLLTINGYDLTYFMDLNIREQLLFPLHMTGKVNTVDIECQVRGGGPSGQSGAIRYGISMALRPFVTAEMREKMRLAGLLTRDKRRRERKKPGQAKARKKFTWKKR